MIKVSLIASSVRPQLYESFFKSLEGTSVEYEVVFSGNKIMAQEDDMDWKDSYHDDEKMVFVREGKHKYILTKNLKPAQCYEIARREAKGECILWVADDCEFPNDVVGKAYKHWKEQNDEKLILSIQTKESGYGNPKGSLFNMDLHRFHGGRRSTPLMAPLGLISRKFLESLGGFDKKYICGQYENQVVIQAIVDGGKVEIFGNDKCFIDIDHLGKSIAIGESIDEKSFQHRPFAKGYSHDRKILEEYCKFENGKIIVTGKFEPYNEVDILNKSQSYKGEWE